MVVVMRSMLQDACSSGSTLRGDMEIRRFKNGDEAALFQVFFTAIHRVASHDYSAEQIQAWAPADLDFDAWASRVRRNQPFVVELGDEIAGFADLQPQGYIDQFFVSGTRPRQGVGNALMRRLHLEAHAVGLSELSADVSRTAEPFFARHQFQVVERRYPVRGGVMIPNAFMKKRLGDLG